MALVVGRFGSLIITGVATIISGIVIAWPIVADDEGEDVARAILACYHPTGVFIDFRNEGQWSGAEEYGTSVSMIYDIRFVGAWTRNEYNVRVALLIRTHGGETQTRGILLSDTAVVPANANCRLKYWN